MSKSAGIKRTKVKSNAKFIKVQWDLVDAKDKDKDAIDKIDKKKLPDSLKNKTKEELKKIVEEKVNNAVLHKNEIDNLKHKKGCLYSCRKSKKCYQ